MKQTLRFILKVWESKLEFVVFFCGAIGMVLELVGSRVISPYFGNSLIVWTSLIGVILGSLSLGYYLGGKLADRFQTYKLLSSVILLSSFLIMISAFIKEPLLAAISENINDLRVSSLLATFILFGPASICLGVVSPYAARLKLVDIKKSGSTVGNLYALSTFGSITGTFMAGFYFIPVYGNTMLLYMLAFFLILISFMANQNMKYLQLFFLAILIIMFYLNQNHNIFKMVAIADIDTEYNRIVVKTQSYNNADIRTLATDNSGLQSAVYVGEPDKLVFNYIKAYQISSAINSNIKSALMIGGAGYTYPRDFISKNPNATIDVVEIDEKMPEVAKKYFYLEDNDRLNLINQDARRYIETSDKKYDVIFLDAFNSVSPPYNLTTQEFMEDLSRHLNKDGFIMINLLSATEGENSKFFQSEINTLKKVYSYVSVMQVNSRSPYEVQNLMVIAYKGKAVNPTSEDAELQNFINTKYWIGTIIGNGDTLTDDYAPVEYLTRHF